MNMGEIAKFVVYVIIFIVYLFFVSTNILLCRIDYDCIAVKCPTILLVPKCINNRCTCIEI
ncbi:late nodulin protein [Medicago truncatula]|uniref:Late nodulin protein n=1 Tax=Medicago truncatula TaxID=3880 RepID=G7J8M8_MEDTR|nr:late nodulin protein [Medicago truncatula]